MFINLDVWAIQSNKEELETALNQIKTGLSIIYSNCTCSFRIGYNKIVSRQFDTLLYNEESDILIMLMRDGKATKDDIIDYLEKHNLPYSEVTFSSHEDEYSNSENIKELWFAREEYVLNDALTESKNKGINSLVYYPNVKSAMTFGYISGVRKQFEFHKLTFRGAVELEDKVVLLMDIRDKKRKKNISIKLKSILSSANRLKMQCDFSYDTTLSIKIKKKKEKQKIKTLF